MNKRYSVCKTPGCTHMMHLAFLLLLAGLFSVSANAGEVNRKFSPPNNFSPPHKVTGKVTDSKNAPLEGVSVVIKGTKQGTTTNAAGVFTLNNVPDNATLIFSSSGFGVREVGVRGEAPVNISLTELVVGLNDVVVVGYGTKTKKDLTGAVSQIKATQLENENPKNISDMLRGNAPGLDVGFDGSTKGNSASLQVRGKGSLSATSTPLIVLDGVIYPGDLSDINPNDIATIDILKDASAAAVYGARSANGIVLVTTKRGKIGKAVISANANFGVNKVVNKPHFLKANEFVNWRQDVLWAMAGFDSTSKPGVQYKFTNPNNLPSGMTVAQWQALDGSTADPTVTWLTRLNFKPVEIANYQAGKSIDWEKLIYNQHAYQQDYTVSVSQRRDDYNYYFSLGYLDNKGLTNGDRFKTLRMRLNLESNIAKFLTVGLNLQVSDRDESSIPLSLTDMQQTSPWGSFYAADGKTLRTSPNDDPGNNTHPFMTQFYSNRMYKYDDFFGTLYAKGKLPYGFSYQVNFTPRFELLREYNFQSPNNPTIASRGGIIDRRNQTLYSWLNDNQVNWNGIFGEHSVEVNLVATAEKFQSWNTTAHAENLAPNGSLGFGSLQSGTATPTVTSDDRYYTGAALLGRLNYNYAHKYFLTASVRRDGFSAFGQKNPYAYFPAVGLSWAFTEEGFMKKTNNWLDYGKLRLSWGINGNRDIPSITVNSINIPGYYAALPIYNSTTYVYVPSNGGTAYNVGQLSPLNLGNENLKWERQGGYNVGVDFSIFKNVLSGSVDYYARNTKDLLVNRSLPSVSGITFVLANLGEVQNKGMEFTLNTINMRKSNFEWKTSFAFWFNRNKIIHLYGATPDYDANGKLTGYSEKNDITNGWFIGKNINTVYDYKVQGVWQTADAAMAKTYGYKPGDFRLQDYDNSGGYTIADKQFLGNTTPDYNWSMRNEFKIFKSFDFAFTLYAKMGQLSQFNEAKNVDKFYDRSNFYSRPYWTPNNPINDYAAMNSNAGGPVSWNVYRKSSFVRLSNVSMAYTLPGKMIQKWHFQSCKIYVNVVNAAVFSKWKFFDPEYHGVSNTNYLPPNNAPTPITYNVGLNLSL